MQTRVQSSEVDLQDQYLVDFMHVAFLGRSTTSLAILHSSRARRPNVRARTLMIISQEIGVPFEIQVNPFSIEGSSRSLDGR